MTQLAVLVLAGGCFWGTEAVFEHVRGVTSVVSGFARPAGAGSSFVPVESVRIEYDPSRVSLQQLYTIFFLVAHDPTSRDRQGPDAGPEYRAVLFFGNAEERSAASAYVAELTRTRRFAAPIVTEVLPLARFAAAPEFHQDFGHKNPTSPYVVTNDAPKVARLKAGFPELYREERAP